MNRLSCVVRWLAMAFVLSVGPLTSAALAVVVTTTDDSVNRIAPPDDPGWSNMGHMSTSSAVYLGNRWVITANHVANSVVTLTDGRVFKLSVGSDRNLHNPGGTSTDFADLRMVRLSTDPGLPTLPIAATTPKAGTTVTMIGAGLDIAPTQVGWKVSSGANGTEWKLAPLPLATSTGYELLTTSHMRWGLNQVMPGGSTLGNANSYVFSTRFDRSGPLEAQAAKGDSGGGVFERAADGTWQLAGIIQSLSTLPGQPTNAVVFGNSTFSVDLSVYRDEILKYINAPEPLWQNQVNYYDVNHSGSVNAQDFLLIVNELQRAGTHSLSGSPAATSPFYDVNGDLSVSPTDAINVANSLILGRAGGALETTSGTNLVPEPSSAVLAAAGALLAALGAKRMRRRKA